MKPRERREAGQNDLFKARLDQIINMSHPLVKLAQAMDWGFLERNFGWFIATGRDSRRCRRS